MCVQDLIWSIEWILLRLLIYLIEIAICFDTLVWKDIQQIFLCNKYMKIYDKQQDRWEISSPDWCSAGTGELAMCEMWGGMLAMPPQCGSHLLWSALEAEESHSQCVLTTEGERSIAIDHIPAMSVGTWRTFSWYVQPLLASEDGNMAYFVKLDITATSLFCQGTVFIYQTHCSFA